MYVTATLGLRAVVLRPAAVSTVLSQMRRPAFWSPGASAASGLVSKQTLASASAIGPGSLPGCIRHFRAVRIAFVATRRCLRAQWQRPPRAHWLVHLVAQALRSASIARARHQRDRIHACTDAAAASHGRLHKSTDAFINSHVADDSTTDLRAHEGGDTGRRLLRLQAAGLDVVERRI